MPYQNDLSTLADVVSPAAAADYAGQQNQMDLQKQQMANQVYQAQMPALEQAPGLENVFKQAQTGLTQGQGMAAQAGGLQALATLPSGIQAGIAGNQAKMTGDQVQKLGNLGQMVGQLAGVMYGIPQATRPAAMQQILQSNNIDPQMIGPLASGDPDMLRQVSQKMIQSSAQYQTQMDLENTRGSYQESVAGIQSSGKVQAAQLTADARENVANINSQVKQKLANYEQQGSQILQRLGTPNEQPGDRQKLDMINQQMIDMRQFGAMTTRALIGMGAYPGSGMEGQTSPSSSMIPQQGGGGNAPASPVNPQAPAMAPMAKQAFGAYEPDKYDYRINPDTGSVQRRPKGK